MSKNEILDQFFAQLNTHKSELTRKHDTLEAIDDCVGALMRLRYAVEIRRRNGDELILTVSLKDPRALPAPAPVPPQPASQPAPPEGQ